MKFEYIRSRRHFLKLGCRALSTAGAATALSRAGLMTARAQTTSDYKALVCIFLFGGNDSNNMLIPNDTTGYANYSKIRSNLAIPQASLVGIHDAATNASYGLHPGFSPIAPKLSTVATSPTPNRCSQIRFTATRAVSGLSRCVSHCANSRRPLSLAPISGFSPGLLTTCGNPRGTVGPSSFTSP